MATTIDEILDQYREPLIQQPLADYFRENEAARRYLDLCQSHGWVMQLDHLTVRCLDVHRRAQPFLAIGYIDHGEVIEYADQGWWAKVFRKPDYPALFIDQAYTDGRGEKSFLPKWAKRFGEDCFHHVAVRIDDIDHVVSVMQQTGIEFSGSIVGARGTRLRQIFTTAEQRDGMAYSVLELTERCRYDGFVPEQADGLMQSSVKTKKD